MIHDLIHGLILGTEQNDVMIKRNIYICIYTYMHIYFPVFFFFYTS
jgi:hypothetical protein